MEKNALTITQQYPAEQFNLLVPMQTVTEIAEIHKPVMNVVQISTKLSDGEIYEQEKAKSAWKGRDGKEHPASPAKYALTKKGLNKLMRAAGIKILYTKPILPATCKKCSEVNKSVGKPVNCGACGNKDVAFEVKISVPQLTGENVEFVAHKEIVVEDVTDTMTEAQKKEFLKFRNEMCETKAINRALRAAMHIKGTYTAEELQKPFVVAYLVPNLDNEDVKAEAIRSFFVASQELFGSMPTIEHKEIVQIEEADSETEVAEEQPVEIIDAQEITEEQPDYDPTICVICGKKCTNGVVKYSQEQYGRTLCMECQRRQEG